MPGSAQTPASPDRPRRSDAPSGTVGKAWSRRQKGATTAAFAGATALVTALLVPLLLAFVWSSEHRAAGERDRYGNTVVSRLAASATEPMLAADRIALSVLVREFTALEGVATAAVYGADDRLLAAADGAVNSPAEFDDRPGNRIYVAQVTLQDSIAGYARIALDGPTFAPDHLPLLAFGIALGLLALASIRFTLQPLQRRLAELRRRLEETLNRRATDADDWRAVGELLTDSEIEASRRQAAGLTESGRPLYLVVVNLFNQVSLTASERSAVIDDCEDLLERVCRLYGGRHERLPGTGLALVLDAVADEGDHAFQAVCAALLAARVFESLNLDRNREGQVQLALRIGVERVLEEDIPGTLTDAALTEACPESLGRAVTLSALARDRAIVISKGVRAGCAEPDRLVAEALASPALRAAGDDSAWLVRDLAEGYRSLLDRQAQLLLGA